ncbi:MAG: arginine deiminase family protein [Anaerolineaceae bacterium]|nr:arginine deiminase family protein [Anaerolineaceae bacterium]
MAIYNNTGVLRKVLLCPPTFYEIVPVSDFSRTALERGDVVDHAKAQSQHNELVGALQDAGIDICYIDEPDPTRHWAVYARDFAVNSPQGAVICRFKFAERKGEEIPGEKQLRKLGIPIFGHVEKGAWEGGDNRYVDEKHLACGQGERSTMPGIRNAAEIYAKMGIKVHGLMTPTKWTHLDGIFAPIAKGLGLIIKSEVPEWFLGFLEGRDYKLIDIPAEKVEGTLALNLLCLGNDRVISFKTNPYVNEIMRAEGIHVYTPDLTEFVDRGGGPHCLTFELERDLN